MNVKPAAPCFALDQNPPVDIHYLHIHSYFDTRSSSVLLSSSSSHRHSICAVFGETFPPVPRGDSFRGRALATLHSNPNCPLFSIFDQYTNSS